MRTTLSGGMYWIIELNLPVRSMAMQCSQDAKASLKPCSTA